MQYRPLGHYFNTITTIDAIDATTIDAKIRQDIANIYKDIINANIDPILF